MSKNIFKRIGTLASAALGGLRATEIEILTPTGGSAGTGIVHQITAESDRVSQALLQGEVTQSVKELRYRTYKVGREAQHYTYFSPTLAKRNKFEKDSDRKLNVENSENMPIVTVQENSVVTQTVLDAIKQVGEHGTSPEHRIKIGRSIIPRFDLEKYATRLVVKDCGDEKHAILDFYVPKYKIPQNRLQNCFVSEVGRMCHEGYRSNIPNIDTVEFITQHAYKLDDLVYFKFDHIYFRGVVEFDGSYVIKFKASYMVNQQDLVMTDYYCPEMEKRYQEKAPKKHHTVSLFPGSNNKTFICDVCGKEVVYDEDAVNEIPATDDTLETNALEYFDMQVIEATYGKKMCLDCFREFQAQLKKQEELDLSDEKQ